MEINHRYNSVERQHYLFNNQYVLKLKPKLLYVGELKKSGNWKEDVHKHDFCEIIFVLEGKGKIVIGENSYNVCKGDLAIYNAGEPHYEESSAKEPMEIRFIALERFIISELPKNHLLPPGYSCVYNTGDYYGLVCDYFERMITEFEKKEAFYGDITQNISRSLVMYILRIINSKLNDSSILQSNKTITAATNYIESNFNQELSLEKVASNCFLNKYYLSHMFSRVKGISIGAYIQKVRIKEACKLLRTTEDSVSLIATSTGFNNVSYFCRAFKKETGITPNQYRKQSKSIALRN